MLIERASIDRAFQTHYLPSSSHSLNSRPALEHSMNSTNRRTKKAPLETDIKGSARKTRAYLEDDEEIARRVMDGETESSVLRDLIHKGLSFERLKKGAGDPALRQLFQAVSEIFDVRLQQTESTIGQLNENMIALNANLENLGNHVDVNSQNYTNLLKYTNWMIAILCLGIAEGFKVPEFDRNSFAVLEDEWSRQYLNIVKLVLTSDRLGTPTQVKASSNGQSVPSSTSA
jgi:hypothetical protein